MKHEGQEKWVQAAFGILNLSTGLNGKPLETRTSLKSPAFKTGDETSCNLRRTFLVVPLCLHAKLLHSATNTTGLTRTLLWRIIGGSRHPCRKRRQVESGLCNAGRMDARCPPCCRAVQDVFHRHDLPLSDYISNCRSPLPDIGCALTVRCAHLLGNPAYAFLPGWVTGVLRPETSGEP